MDAIDEVLDLDVDPANGNGNGPAGHQRVRTVDRAIKVLAVLAESTRPLTLTGVAQAAGLSPATALRLLRTLQAEDLVQAAPQPEHYQLGFRILQFSQALLRQLDIVAVARPIVARVRDVCDETTGIGMRTGDFWVHVLEVESALAIRRVSNLTERLPLYAGSTGKVFLAAMPADEFEDYLRRTERVAFSERTPVLAEDLRRQVAETRERGYALSINERGEGGAGMAAPVYNHDGRMIASLTISGPALRFTPERMTNCAETVLAASAQLSEALGYRRA